MSTIICMPIKLYLHTYVWAGFNIGATSVEAGTGFGQLPTPGSYSPVASKMGLTGQSQD